MVAKRHRSCRAILKAGMMERRNDGMAESRNLERLNVEHLIPVTTTVCRPGCRDFKF